MKKIFGINRKNNKPNLKKNIFLWNKQNCTLTSGDDIIVDEEAEIIGRFQDKTTALTKKNFGQGKAIFANFAIPPCDPALKEFQLFNKWFREFLRNINITPPVEIKLANGNKPQRVEVVSFCSNPYTVLGILNHYNNPDQSLIITLPEKMYVNDIRTGKQLGELKELKLYFKRGEVKLLSVSARNNDKIKINTPNSDSSMFSFLTGLFDSSSAVGTYKPGDKVAILLESTNVPVNAVRANVFDPDGNPVQYYNTNILLRNGKGVLEIPTALNDKKGNWSVELFDILTCSRIKLKFKQE